MARSEVTIRQEQVVGENLAIKIKDYYFGDRSWDIKLAFHIGYMMKDLKKAATIFFCDKDIVTILHILTGYTKEELDEMFEYYADYLKGNIDGRNPSS